ncbi:MAG TPA: nitrite/sulfite reductase, partial [Methylovirgula sp.]
FDRLVAAGLATGNAGLVTDIISCPGLDYCALATARSIPIAQRISERFGDAARAADIGSISINISGCINACGHHHVGNIGILGIDKGGVESYQITLGGSADESCALGKLTGPGFSTEDVVDSVEIIVDTYLELRTDKAEDFLSTYRRVGMPPFKKALYERFQGNAI